MRRKRQAQRDRHAEHQRNEKDAAQQVEPPMEEFVVRIKYDGGEAQWRRDDTETKHHGANDHQKGGVQHEDQKRNPANDDRDHVVARGGEYLKDMAEPSLTRLESAEK